MPGVIRGVESGQHFAVHGRQGMEVCLLLFGINDELPNGFVAVAQARLVSVVCQLNEAAAARAGSTAEAIAAKAIAAAAIHRSPLRCRSMSLLMNRTPWTCSLFMTFFPFFIVFLSGIVPVCDQV